MRTALDALLLQKSLEFVQPSTDCPGFDRLPGLKNVCARVDPDLAGEIDKVVGVLGITKRRFLEAAFRYAVDRAHQVMREEGVFDQIDSDQVRPDLSLEFSEGDLS